MNQIAVLLLIAAFLPYVCAILAKAGGAGFDNRAPRDWLARQDGWRARANAAQQNLFEGLPLYYVAVLFALLVRQAEPETLALWMWGWTLLRLGYVAAYVGNRGGLRSLLWAGALAVNVWVLLVVA